MGKCYTLFTKQFQLPSHICFPNSNFQEINNEMKIVYSPKYREVYAYDPAAALGRIECIYMELQGRFEFIEPRPAIEEDIRLVHWQSHVERVKRLPQVYEIASLAVGGAIKTAETSLKGEPAFGLIRPPGHHASPDSSWGFCYFNNIAISIEKLRMEKRINKALIVDFDLHFGDGTANTFANVPEVTYFHTEGATSLEFLENLQKFLLTHKEFDIVAVSAGFDKHVQDWGGVLKTEDYMKIGRILKEFSKEVCGGRRYAVLEGGYNQAVLGKNVKAFLEGFE